MKKLLLSLIPALPPFAQHAFFFGASGLMKRLILSLLLCSPAFAGYGFVRSVTIDHTQAGASDSTNFPVVFTGTYAYLAGTSSGGNVTSSAGYDIVFTSDAGCSTLLNFERVIYIGTTGLVEFWINLPTVSHTVNTVFYECYGNAAVVTDQSNPTATWGNYKAVYHLQDSVALGGTVPDSTTTNNGTAAGLFGTTATAAVINNGYQCTPACDSYVDLGAMSNVFNCVNTSLTVETWEHAGNPGLITVSTILGVVSGSTARVYALFSTASNGTQLTYCTTSGCSNYGQVYITGTASNPNTYNHLVFVLDLTTITNSAIYLNGVAQTVTQNLTSSPPTVFSALGSDVTLMVLSTNGFTGNLDEVHIETFEPSADWVLAEYNNQKTGSTFLTISSLIVRAPIAGGIIDGPLAGAP